MWPSLVAGVKGVFSREAPYQKIMFVSCVLFGIAMIANTHPAGDGGWYWYASSMREGKLLYSDLHLALQPLFVVETAWFMGLAGKGWLVSKIPAVLHLVAYCFGIVLLLKYSDLRDGHRAILLGFSFFVSICFAAYRFDDYHVMADCFQLYSLVLLLKLESVVAIRLRVSVAAALGILSGLTITTRLNDGAALLLGVAIALVCVAKRNRLLLSMVMCVAAGLTVVLVVATTGDTFHNYLVYSVFRAAGSKGGASSVLVYPLKLPWNALIWLRSSWYEPVTAFILEASLVWAFLLRPEAWRGQRGKFAIPVIGVVLLVLFFAAPRGQIYRPFLGASAIPYFAAFGVIALYCLGIFVFVTFLRWLATTGREFTWDHREILLIIPLGQLASASMSSGGVHLGLYGPLAVASVLLAIASPVRLRWKWSGPFLYAFATLLMCSAAALKYRVPFSWHSYQAKRMFVGRQWYNHPDYGPMLIDNDQLALFQTICGDVAKGGSENELLSLPLPYANYFCSIAPWHGYVQTFFDTSSKETIFGLIDELEKAPPKWILYQRQMVNLRRHEIVYNAGAPLPQRNLDSLIEHKLGSGQWQAVYASSFGDLSYSDNHWILIRTRP